MVPSLRHLSAGILLALAALVAVIIAYSAVGEPRFEKPVVGQETLPAEAQKPAATLEHADLAEETVTQETVAKESAAAVAKKPKLVQSGPILLPPNPAYLNALIEDQAAAPPIEAAEEQASSGEDETEEATRDAAADRQPPEAEYPSEAHYAPEADYAPEAGHAPEEGFVEEEAPPEEQEPAQREQPVTQEQPTVKELLAAEEPAAEARPSEPLRGTSQEQAPQTTLPETSTPPQPRRELTPALVALRDLLRRTVADYHSRALSATENTATEVMHCCLAFGCTTEIYRSGWSGKRVNGITCLCWNYPCRGYELLGLSEGRIAPRIGYGLQEQPSQLLAVLALSRVKPTYPVRVGENVRTVADLVEYEKLSCRSGTDLSLKLIGLAYYMGDGPTWENSLGQQWSVERIVKEELDQPVLGAGCGGICRLMGLSYALARLQKRPQPVDGPFGRARQFIDQFHDYALKLQNPDGSWGPDFPAAGGTTRDEALQLRSTGHVLEWLATSLPEDRLDDPRVVRSVELLGRLLGSQRYRQNLGSLSTREMGSLMHGLHALVVYDERFFQPRAAAAPAP
jgi:chemotaxis protein histidine kinase CheA